MTQLVFIHGPGAGACADCYEYQLKHFKGSVAPTLPGHLEGTRCPDVARYTDWVRGWLWAQGMKKDLVDRKSTRLNSSHSQQSRMPSSA